MAAIPPAQPPPPPDSGGIHIGDVGGSVNFSALGDIVGGDKITTITTTIQISVEAVTQQPLVTASPYRGLDRFEDRDKDLFFGRDQLIKSLLAQLSASNVLLVLGASGSGKSSVVRAGLLPQLAQLIGARFRYFTFVPDVNPFESLRASLLAAGFSQTQTRELADAKPETPAKLARTLQRSGDQWLFFIDQFEEIFTVGDEKLRASFIEALVQIAQDASGSTKLVLAMRADFLDRFSPFPQFAKIIEKNIDFVADMHADELRQAIEQPAARHGVVFEQGLVEEIIKDVQGQAGSLPLLQYTLDLLWQEEAREDGLADRHLNARAYRELGGVRGALQKRADEIYELFGDGTGAKAATPKQEIVRQIFLRLVDLAGEGSNDAAWRPVRRRASMRMFTAAQEQEILQALINQKLLVSNREGDDATVEVAHEALFTSWGRLKNWIEAGKQVIFAKNRLTDDARRWQRRQQERNAEADEELLSGSRLSQALDMRARGDFTTVIGGLGETETQFLDASVALRDKQRRIARRRVRFTVIGLVLALAVISGAAVVALRQRNDAKAALGKARAALARQLAVQSRIAVETRPQLGLLLALEALNVTAKESEKRVPAAEEALRMALSITGGQTVARDSATIDTVAISSDEKWLVTGSESGLRLWKRDTGGQRYEPAQLQSAAAPVFFSPDGHWLVTSSTKSESSGGQYGAEPEHEVLLWDLRTSDGVAKPYPLAGSVNAAAFSPDNHWLATGGTENTALLWDLSGGAPGSQPLTLVGHTKPVSRLTISPDSAWLVTASHYCTVRSWQRDNTVRVWDLKSADPRLNPKILSGHESAISTVAISPDSRWIATAGSGCGGSDKSIRVWDLKAQAGTSASRVLNTGPVPQNNLESVVASDRILSLSFGFQSRWLVSVAESRDEAENIQLWDLDAKEPTPAKRIPMLEARRSRGPVTATSSNGRWLATASSDNVARLWDLGAAEPLENPRVLRGHDGPVGTIAFRADNLSVVTGSSDRTARLWNLATPEAGADPIVLPSQGDTTFILSSDSRWLATRRSEYSVAQLWDLATPDPMQIPAVFSADAVKNAFLEFAFSPDGQWLMGGDTEGKTRLWQLRAKSPGADPIVISGHTSHVSAILSRPDKGWLATGSFDGTIRMYDLSAREPFAQPRRVFEASKDKRGGTKAVYKLTASVDGRWLLATGLDSLLWDLTAAETAPAISLPGVSNQLGSFAMSPDGRWLATAARDTATEDDIRRIDEALRTKPTSPEDRAALRKQREELSRPRPPVTRLYDLSATNPGASVRAVEPGGMRVAISPDNHWLIIAGPEGPASLWDLTAKNPLANERKLSGHTQEITMFAFSPDHHRLGTASRDGTARVWDLQKLDSAPIVLSGHSAEVEGIVFSADSQWVVTSDSQSVRLWDLAAEDAPGSAIILPTKESTSLSGGVRPTTSTPDGRWLIASGRGGVWLLRMRLPELIEQACQTAGRNLTEEEWRLYFPGQPRQKTCPALP